MKYIVGFLAILVIVLPANSDCRVRQRVVVQKQVVQEVVAAVVATPVIAQYVPITIPAYGVSYVGDGYGGGNNAEVAKLRESVDRLERLITSLARGERPLNRGDDPSAAQGPEGVPAPAAAKEPSIQERAVSLVQAKCASCHTGPNAKGPGGTHFSMFDPKGQLTVHPKLLGAVYRGKTADGKVMPPDGKGFTNEEVAIIQDGLGR